MNINTSIKIRVLAAVTLIGALMGALAFGLTYEQDVQAGPEDPEPGTVKGADLYTLYDAYTTTATAVYPSDTGRLRYYNSIELFVTADFSTTGAITVTPQYSVDGSNWITATYTYVGTPLNYSTTSTNTQTLSDNSTVTATTVSTSTATVTGTMSTSGTSNVTSTVTATGTPTEYEQTYQLTLSADGTDHLAMPMRGLYVRPVIRASNTNGVTVTIYAVAKNN
jgi:hypothetical protein